jgi:Flp pilus assembly protein TadG
VDADADPEARGEAGLRRLREESGQASVEFAGSVFLMVLLALAVWQGLLVMWTFNQASNAARTAARVDTRGGDTHKAARNALPKVMRKKLKVEINGEKVAVGVRIPIFIPGLYKDDVRAWRKAVLPD